MPPFTQSGSQMAKENKNKHLTAKRVERIMYTSCCCFTCLTVQSRVAGFAAARVGRRALHVPATHVSAHSWKNGDKRVSSCWRQRSLLEEVDWTRLCYVKEREQRRSDLPLQARPSPVYPTGHLPQRKPPPTVGSHRTPGKHGRSAQLITRLSAVVPILPPGWVVVGLCSGEQPYIIFPGVVKVSAGKMWGVSGPPALGSASSPSAEKSDSDSE